MIPFLQALGLVVAVTILLLLAGALLGVERVETFPLIYMLVLAFIAWRYGRGPAVTAAVLALVSSDFLLAEPSARLGIASPSDLVRLITFALAAAGVIEVIHLTRASTQQLAAREERQRARLQLLEDITRRIVQSLNADEIVNTVAEQTLRVIEYHHFRLYRWDERSERLLLVKAVARAAPYDHADWERAAVQLTLADGVTGLAARTRRSILVPDASRDPRIVYVPGAQRISESVLSVPMVTGGRLFGVLALARLGAGSLTEADSRLIEVIAAQTALALANAEQYAGAEQIIQALTAIEALDHPPESEYSDAELHQRIIAALCQVAGAAVGGLRLRTRADGRYHLAAGFGALPPNTSTPPAGPLDTHQLDWLAGLRTPYYVAETQSDELLPAWARQLAEGIEIRTSVFLPLRARSELLGFASLHWFKTRQLAPQELGRLQLVAAQATLTLENRRALREERDRAEKLAELERSRREFMQIASHELRTPLSVLRGYTSMLQDGSLGALPEQARDAIRILFEKAAEMGSQIERMLFLARLEDGRLAFSKRRLELGTLVGQALERLRPQLQLRQGTLVEETQDGLLILGDADRLGMALDNLLQNAVKFTVAPPRIEVVARRVDTHAELVIRDHGVGMTPEALSHLFEKFFRSDDPQLRHVTGSGIGLYVVKQVIDAHAGSIAVSSEPGAGTSFTIRLPLVAGEPITGAQARPPDERPAPDSPTPPSVTPEGRRRKSPLGR